MSVFGALPFGTEEATPLPAIDWATLPQSAVSDAVTLVEVSATDGAITTIDAPDVFGASPFGTMPGGVLGGTVELRWSDVDWTSSPTDTLPNTHFEGRAADITLDRALPVLPDAARRVAAALRAELATLEAECLHSSRGSAASSDGLGIAAGTAPSGAPAARGG